MKAVLLAACMVLAVGCTLSKDESTLARLHEEQVNKKKELPRNFFTEEKMGVRYYPDADAIQSKEFDEGGFHVLEADLNSRDSLDKVAAFYEKELGAKSVELMRDMYRIQKDEGGKHYEVSYGKFDQDTSISIKVSTPTPPTG